MTVTTNEAAALAGVRPRTIRQWVLHGWLEPTRRGAKPLRFHYADVAKAQRDHRPGTWEARHAERVSRWLDAIDARTM